GRSGSPCSNSTQTAAPTLGNKLATFSGAPHGIQGIAHIAVTPETSGTWTIIRPICIGSMFSITKPRYFPKYFLLATPGNPDRPSSVSGGNWERQSSTTATLLSLSSMIARRQKWGIIPFGDCGIGFGGKAESWGHSTLPVSVRAGIIQ